MFVDEDPGLGWHHNGCKFAIIAPDFVVEVRVVEPNARADSLTDRIAADARFLFAVDRHPRPIGRTLEVSNMGREGWGLYPPYGGCPMYAFPSS